MGSMANIKTALKRTKDSQIRERLLMVQSSYEQPLRDVAKTRGCTHGKIDFWKKRGQEPPATLAGLDILRIPPKRQVP